VTGSLAVRPQPGHTPHLLPTFAISVLYLVLCWRSWAARYISEVAQLGSSWPAVSCWG